MKINNKNYDYFKQNFETLYKEYKEKYVVIKNEKIIGVYDNFDMAYNETKKTEELGTFIIQHCTKDKTELGCFYSSNVSFA